MITEPERFPRDMARDLLTMIRELLATRKQIHERSIAIEQEAATLNEMSKQVGMSLNYAGNLLHLYGVKLPAEAYAILGLFEEGTELPL
jgi:hypothetical protein